MKKHIPAPLKNNLNEGVACYLGKSFRILDLDYCFTPPKYYQTLQNKKRPDISHSFRKEVAHNGNDNSQK